MDCRKERVLKDRIIVRHKQPNKTPTKEEQVTAADDKEEEVENVEPLTDGKPQNSVSVGTTNSIPSLCGLTARRCSIIDRRTPVFDH